MQLQARYTNVFTTAGVETDARLEAEWRMLQVSRDIQKAKREEIDAATYSKEVYAISMLSTKQGSLLMPGIAAKAIQAGYKWKRLATTIRNEANWLESKWSKDFKEAIDRLCTHEIVAQKHRDKYLEAHWQEVWARAKEAERDGQIIINALLRALASKARNVGNANEEIAALLLSLNEEEQTNAVEKTNYGHLNRSILDGSLEYPRLALKDEQLDVAVLDFDGYYYVLEMLAREANREIKRTKEEKKVKLYNIEANFVATGTE